MFVAKLTTLFSAFFRFCVSCFNCQLFDLLDLFHLNSSSDRWMPKDIQNGFWPALEFPTTELYLPFLKQEESICGIHIPLIVLFSYVLCAIDKYHFTTPENHIYSMHGCCHQFLGISRLYLLFAFKTKSNFIKLKFIR